MSYRQYSLGTYEGMRAAHQWEVPERYNIARDVCDKHPRDKLAMIWEDWRGTERRVFWGELQDIGGLSPCSTSVRSARVKVSSMTTSTRSSVM